MAFPILGSRNRLSGIDKHSVVPLLIPVLVLSVLSQTTDQLTIKHDLSAYVAPADSLARGAGAPYSDYWDIKPPLLIAINYAWILAFGKSLFGFYVFLGLVLGATLIISHRILQTSGSPLLSSLGLLSTGAVMVGSRAYGGMFFPCELLGLLPVLGGCLVLLRGDGAPWRIGAAAFLFAAASQIKDVYIFTPATLIPFLSAPTLRKFVNHAASTVLGCALAAAVTMAFLLYSGSLHSYFQVVRAKQTLFHVPSTAMTARSFASIVAHSTSAYAFLGFLTPFVTAGLFLGLKTTGKASSDIIRDVIWSKTWIAAANWLLVAIVLGMVWQGKPVTEHYAVSIQIPLLLSLAGNAYFIRSSYAKLRDRQWRSTVATALSILLIMPSTSVAIDFLRSLGQKSAFAVLHRYQDFESAQSVDPFKVSSRSCLQVAYGWAGSYYFYSSLLPCSRFFLSPLVARQPAVQEEFRSDLVKTPPGAIVYRRSGAAVDVADFEAKIFPYERVLKSCYVEREPVKYLWIPAPGLHNDELLRECIRTSLLQFPENASGSAAVRSQAGHGSSVSDVLVRGR